MTVPPLPPPGIEDAAPALQARIDALAAIGGGILDLPAAPHPLVCHTPLTWRSGVILRGAAPGLSQIQLAPGCRAPLIDLTGVTGAGFENLGLIGTGHAAGSDEDVGCALYSCGPCADITISRCQITDWACSCIALDGVTGFELTASTLARASRGGGLILSKGLPSRNLRISGNRISHTQFGNIHAWGPVQDVIVTDNRLERSGWTGGSYATQDVADNITLYADARSRNIVIRGNICLNSGENGIHAAADGLIIQGNIIRDAALYGIIVSHKPYAHPEPSHRTVISGNVISFSNPEDPHARAIGLRNCQGFVVEGNQITGAHLGIEVLGLGPAALAGPGQLRQNLLLSGGAQAFRLRQLSAPVVVEGNLWQARNLRCPEDLESPLVLLGENPRIPQA